MGIRQYKNKRDAVEPEVIATLEAHGIQVHTMDEPCDLLTLFGGVVRLVEVKAPKGKLTAAQDKFVNEMGWPVAVLRSVEDAEKWAKEVRNGRSAK